MITPYYFQEEATQAVFDFLNLKPGNPLVCLPTGTGKSVVIANILRNIFAAQPYRRALLLTHVWKLIQQNAEKMLNMWPEAPLGIHSAGLGQRDTIAPIIFGGIQSVAKTLEKDPRAFGHQDIILIDEAHLLGDDEDSQYLKVFAILKRINPDIRLVGFTATDYRLKMGKLVDGGVFTDIAYNLTGYEQFQRLIAEGYLCPLIGKPTETKIEGIDDLKIIGGDFNQKQAAELIGKSLKVEAACRELLQFGANRNKCMGFAAGVENAEEIASMLQSMGVPAACVHSKLKESENKARLAAYSAGDLWAIIGANMLTTGYDEPTIDLIADFQPTCSPGKHVQKLGRGTRVHPSKSNTLVLDFVGNIGRNGPIDDPRTPRKPGQKTGDPPPVKICETIKLQANQQIFEEWRKKGIKVDFNSEELTKGCGGYNHASLRFCCNCAQEFSFKNHVEETAYNDSPMKVIEQPVFERVPIHTPILYTRNKGKEKALGIIGPPTIKAIYPFGMLSINLFLCFEHTGFARHRAHEWWKMHSATPPPSTVEEFLARTHELRVPKSILVHANAKFPEIKSYEF